MKWTLPGIRNNSYGLALLCLLSGSGLAHAQSPGQLEAGLFSSSRPGASLPDGWQPLTFSRIPRHSDYSLVDEDGTLVIKAVSEQSASGLVRQMSIDPSAYPLIQWRWKVNNVLQKGDVTRKDGDDYPARIYISFAFDPGRASYLERLKYETARFVRGEDLPYRAISYIWGNNSPAGTMIANAYTEQAMMFVVQSGAENIQHWMTEQRDVYADYKKAFGEEPTMISGIAIMTDTDNTRESAVAWYGDIVFSSRQAVAD
ncbi:MAG: DUF3047 domain-containing protein [Gammaproteobacteria bacterium]